MIDLLKNIKEITCKGLFWRGNVNSYVSSHNSIESHKSLRLLKKRSCKGCADCEWVLEFLKEDISNEQYDPLEQIQHGKIYTFGVITSTEWESGHTEVDAIEFKEVTE